MTAAQPQNNLDIWTIRITRWLSWLLSAVSSHWLLLANLGLGFYVALPFLAPILAHGGLERTARIIYWIFRPLCHQLPERSFFLFGEHPTYSLEQLGAHLSAVVPTRYTGDAIVGFKVAVCERCVALYGSMLLFGIAFTWLRTRLKPLTLKQFALMAVPMAIDGFGQLFGLWHSTWLTRIITGAIFGIGTIWLMFPYLQSGMSEVHESTHTVLKESH